MENIDKFTKFIILEEYLYDVNGGDLNIIFQCIREINNYNLINKNNNIDIFNKNTNNIGNYTQINEYDDLKIYINSLLQNNFCYIPIIIPQHLFGIFLYKLSNGNFDISIINTGAGIDYQKMFNKIINNKKFNFTNGIILFRNILK